MSLRNSNSSSRSGTFSLSELSSSQMSHKPKLNRQSCRRFVDRVCQLFSSSSEDLDALYETIQTYSRHYFSNNSITDYSQLQHHLEAIRCSNDTMKQIVQLLMKNLLKEVPRQRRFNQSNTRPGSKSRIDVHNTPINLSRIDSNAKLHQQNEPYGLTQQRESESNKYLQGHRSKQQMSSTSTSFEQYHNRNKVYQDKIKRMITELEAIKIELGNSRPMQSIEKKEDNSNQMDQLGSPSSKSSNEDIVINTVPSNYTFIDLCDQNHFQSEVAKQQEQQKSHEQDNNSVITSQIEDRVKRKQKEQIGQTTPMTIAESSEKQHRLDQIVRRNQVLMDYARNVAKQIEQLKSAATKLVNYQRSRIQSDDPSTLGTKQLCSQSISIKTKEQSLNQRQPHPKKVQFLDSIQNAVSKFQITEKAIYNESIIRELNSSKIIDQLNVNTEENIKFDSEQEKDNKNTGKQFGLQHMSQQYYEYAKNTNEGPTVQLARTDFSFSNKFISIEDKVNKTSHLNDSFAVRQPITPTNERTLHQITSSFVNAELVRAERRSMPNELSSKGRRPQPNSSLFSPNKRKHSVEASDQSLIVRQIRLQRRPTGNQFLPHLYLCQPSQIERHQSFMAIPPKQPIIITNNSIPAPLRRFSLVNLKMAPVFCQQASGDSRNSATSNDLNNSRFSSRSSKSRKKKGLSLLVTKK